ncbi:hypothetical protein TGVAND_261660 [Toxoplasma gondii VAND]|uniref:Uncharacterized protein n=1 Tax=Toxoplasma gondii VAND TaxID=933077 RepID=A0A086QD41_TOXGO|nr:hypothetical protein TGVAND_261660 [Toxoplasma gondii VAND]
MEGLRSAEERTPKTRGEQKRSSRHAPPVSGSLDAGRGGLDSGVRVDEQGKKSISLLTSRRSGCHHSREELVAAPIPPSPSSVSTPTWSVPCQRKSSSARTLSLHFAPLPSPISLFSRRWSSFTRKHRAELHNPSVHQSASSSQRGDEPSSFGETDAWSSSSLPVTTEGETSECREDAREHDIREQLCRAARGLSLFSRQIDFADFTRATSFEVLVQYLAQALLTFRLHPSTTEHREGFFKSAICRCYHDSSRDEGINDGRARSLPIGLCCCRGPFIQPEPHASDVLPIRCRPQPPLILSQIVPAPFPLQLRNEDRTEATGLLGGLFGSTAARHAAVQQPAGAAQPVALRCTYTLDAGVCVGPAPAEAARTRRGSSDWFGLTAFAARNCHETKVFQSHPNPSPSSLERHLLDTESGAHTTGSHVPELDEGYCRKRWEAKRKAQAAEVRRECTSSFPSRCTSIRRLFGVGEYLTIEAVRVYAESTHADSNAGDGGLTSGVHTSPCGSWEPVPLTRTSAGMLQNALSLAVVELQHQECRQFHEFRQKRLLRRLSGDGTLEPSDEGGDDGRKQVESASSRNRARHAGWSDTVEKQQQLSWELPVFAVVDADQDLFVGSYTSWASKSTQEALPLGGQVPASSPACRTFSEIWIERSGRGSQGEQYQRICGQCDEEGRAVSPYERKEHNHWAMIPEQGIPRRQRSHGAPWMLPTVSGQCEFFAFNVVRRENQDVGLTGFFNYFACTVGVGTPPALLSPSGRQRQASLLRALQERTRVSLRFTYFVAELPSPPARPASLPRPTFFAKSAAELRRQNRGKNRVVEEEEPSSIGGAGVEELWESANVMERTTRGDTTLLKQETDFSDESRDQEQDGDEWKTASEGESSDKADGGGDMRADAPSLSVFLHTSQSGGASGVLIRKDLLLLLSVATPDPYDSLHFCRSLPFRPLLTYRSSGSNASGRSCFTGDFSEWLGPQELPEATLFACTLRLTAHRALLQRIHRLHRLLLQGELCITCASPSSPSSRDETRQPPKANLAGDRSEVSLAFSRRPASAGGLANLRGLEAEKAKVERSDDSDRTKRSDQFQFKARLEALAAIAPLLCRLPPPPETGELFFSSPAPEFSPAAKAGLRQSLLRVLETQRHPGALPFPLTARLFGLSRLFGQALEASGRFAFDAEDRNSEAPRRWRERPLLDNTFSPAAASCLRSQASQLKTHSFSQFEGAPTNAEGRAEGNSPFVDSSSGASTRARDFLPPTPVRPGEGPSGRASLHGQETHSPLQASFLETEETGWYTQKATRRLARERHVSASFSGALDCQTLDCMPLEAVTKDEESASGTLEAPPDASGCGSVLPASSGHSSPQSRSGVAFSSERVQLLGDLGRGEERTKTTREPVEIWEPRLSGVGGDTSQTSSSEENVRPSLSAWEIPFPFEPAESTTGGDTSFWAGGEIAFGAFETGGFRRERSFSANEELFMQRAVQQLLRPSEPEEHKSHLLRQSRKLAIVEALKNLRASDAAHSDAAQGPGFVEREQPRSRGDARNVFSPRVSSESDTFLAFSLLVRGAPANCLLSELALAVAGLPTLLHVQRFWSLFVVAVRKAWESRSLLPRLASAAHPSPVRLGAQRTLKAGEAAAGKDAALARDSPGSPVEGPRARGLVEKSCRRNPDLGEDIVKQREGFFSRRSSDSLKDKLQRWRCSPSSLARTVVAGRHSKDRRSGNSPTASSPFLASSPADRSATDALLSTAFFVDASSLSSPSFSSRFASPGRAAKAAAAVAVAAGASCAPDGPVGLPDFRGCLLLQHLQQLNCAIQQLRVVAWEDERTARSASLGEGSERLNNNGVTGASQEKDEGSLRRPENPSAAYMGDTKSTGPFESHRFLNWTSRNGRWGRANNRKTRGSGGVPVLLPGMPPVTELTLALHRARLDAQLVTSAEQKREKTGCSDTGSFDYLRACRGAFERARTAEFKGLQKSELAQASHLGSPSVSPMAPAFSEWCLRALGPFLLSSCDLPALLDRQELLLRMRTAALTAARQTAARLSSFSAFPWEKEDEDFPAKDRESEWSVPPSGRAEEGNGNTHKAGKLCMKSNAAVAVARAAAVAAEATANHGVKMKENKEGVRKEAKTVRARGAERVWSEADCGKHSLPPNRFFDAVVEGEMALHYLESVSAVDLLQQLLCCLMTGAVETWTTACACSLLDAAVVDSRLSGEKHPSPATPRQELACLCGCRHFLSPLSPHVSPHRSAHLSSTSPTAASSCFPCELPALRCAVSDLQRQAVLQVALAPTSLPSDSSFSGASRKAEAALGPEDEVSPCAFLPSLSLFDAFLRCEVTAARAASLLQKFDRYADNLPHVSLSRGVPRGLPSLLGEAALRLTERVLNRHLESEATGELEPSLFECVPSPCFSNLTPAPIELEEFAQDVEVPVDDKDEERAVLAYVKDTEKAATRGWGECESNSAECVLAEGDEDACKPFAVEYIFQIASSPTTHSLSSRNKRVFQPSSPSAAYQLISSNPNGATASSSSSEAACCGTHAGEEKTLSPDSVAAVSRVPRAVCCQGEDVSSFFDKRGRPFGLKEKQDALQTSKNEETNPSTEKNRRLSGSHRLASLRASLDTRRRGMSLSLMKADGRKERKEKDLAEGRDDAAEICEWGEEQAEEENLREEESPAFLPARLYAIERNAQCLFAGMVTTRLG